MIQTRGRKILHDILSRKTRTALVSFSIFIGVLGVVTLFSMGDILTSRLHATIDQQKLAMTHQYVTVNRAEPVENAPVLNLIRSLENVSAAQGMLLYPAEWKPAGQTEFEDGRILAYSEPFDALILEPVTLVAGRYPAAGRHEIALERRLLDEHGLQIGDSITFRPLNGVEENWTIVGSVYQPYQYPLGPGSPTIIAGETMIFAAFEDAQAIVGAKGFNVFQVRYDSYADAEAVQQRLEGALTDSTPYVAYSHITQDPAKNASITTTETFSNVLAMLAVVALLVSGFLVFNVINALVMEQKRQIGTLKSLGADSKDTVIMYAGLALIYGIIGVIPGVMLGIPASFAAAKVLAPQFNIFLDEFALSSAGIMMGVGLGLLVPLLASAFPVMQGLRVTIIEAMTDLGISSSMKGGLLLRLLDRLPLPMNIRQSVRNVLQKRGRLILNVATLALASGAFMGVSGMLMVLDRTMDDIFATFGSEIVVMPGGTSDLEQAQALVRDEVEGVELVSPATLMVVEIEGYAPPQMAGGVALPLYVFGFNTEDPQLFNFHLSEGSAWESGRDGMVVTKGIMDRMGKKLGDTLTLRVGDNRASYEIIGISTYPFDNLWLPWAEVSQLAGMDDPNAFYIMLQDDAMTSDEVNDKIKEINAVLLANGISATYINWTLSQETASQLLVTFTMTLNIAALLIGLVGALGLLSSLSMSVFERQKEIGVMRSVGASSSTIAAQFMTEGLIVGLIAWAMGIPLSIGMYDGLLGTFNFKDAITDGLPVIVLGLGLVGMCLVASIASLSPSLAAARKTVSDILRYQ